MLECKDCQFCKCGNYLKFKCPYFCDFPEDNYNPQKSERDDVSQMYLAYCLLYGHRTPKNEKKAVAILKKLSKKDFAPAQYILSDCYYRGIVVKQNLTTAFYWCKKAADHRCNLAVNQTYENYLMGIGTEQDCKLAKKYCGIAVVLENEKLYFNYADMCCSEKYGEISIEEACRYYRKAYENGSKAAMEKLKELHRNHIKECYESQHGRIFYDSPLLAIHSNEKFADYCIDNKFVCHFKTAIEHYRIVLNECNKCIEIAGVPKEVKRLEKKMEDCLARYFEEVDTENKELFDSALSGQAWAQNNIGCLFFDSEYDLHDYEEAKKWFSLAAERGNEQAIENLEICKKQITALSKPCSTSTAYQNYEGQSMASNHRYSDEPSETFGYPDIVYPNTNSSSNNLSDDEAWWAMASGMMDVDSSGM